MKAASGCTLGYLQVDENQLLWCNEQAQQLLSLQGAGTGALAGLVRSYELDQLIEQTREQQQARGESGYSIRLVRMWLMRSTRRGKVGVFLVGNLWLTLTLIAGFLI